MTEPAATDSPSASRSGRDLPMAIAIGLVLAGSFLAATFWSPLAASLFIMVFMVLGSIEAAAELRRVGRTSVVPVLVATSIVITLSTYRSGPLGQVVGVLVLFLGSAVWMLLEPDVEGALARTANTVLLGLWMPVMGSFAVLLVTGEDGAVALVLTIAAAAVADVGAYAVGSLLGRHKIAPRLSPNKTWEGLLGGLVLAGAAAWLVVPLMSDDFGAVNAVVVAVVVSLAGFVGDLFESMVKRDLGIKDFGSFLPGHGGILDRVDGILLALPVGWVMVVLLT